MLLRETVSVHTQQTPKSQPSNASLGTVIPPPSSHRTLSRTRIRVLD